MLGLGVGARPDDYELSGVDFHRRGRIFDEQLARLMSIWAGEGGVGPEPPNGRPGLLIGGGSDHAYRRAAEHADGWTYGGGPPDVFAGAVDKLREAWQAAGREGEPRKVALFYFCLGEDAERVAEENLGHYYAWLGEYAKNVAESAAKDPEAVRERLAAFEQAGADEVICFPASTDPAQVELLASAAGLG